MTVQLQKNPPAERRSRGRIGVTLIVAFVLLAVVPGAVAVITGLYVLQQQTRAQVVNQLQSVADIKNNQINDWLNGKQLLLRSFLADSGDNNLMVQSFQVGDYQGAAQ